MNGVHSWCPEGHEIATFSSGREHSAPVAVHPRQTSGSTFQYRRVKASMPSGETLTTPAARPFSFIIDTHSLCDTRIAKRNAAQNLNECVGCLLARDLRLIRTRFRDPPKRFSLGAGDTRQLGSDEPRASSPMNQLHEAQKQSVALSQQANPIQICSSCLAPRVVLLMSRSK